MSNDESRQGPASDDRASTRGERLRFADSAHVASRYTDRKRSRVAATAHRRSGVRTNLGSSAERYQRYRRGRHGQRTYPPTPATAMSAAAVSPTPLGIEFNRAEREQESARNTIGYRLRRMTGRRWFWPAVGIPGVLALILLLVASPLLYSAFTAYRDVQVDPVNHIQSAFVPQLNESGTPELVAAPLESSLFDEVGDERMTILLLGVDKSVNGASRTDTLILVNIDPKEKTASMLSIPRDLKVVIPGYGIDKINASFALGEFNKVQGGGAGLTIRTIEANLGIPISAFVQIDFNGFIDMVDTVGGITLDVPYPIKDDTYPAEGYRYQRIYFPAGWQHMDGEQALDYARTRHQDGDSRRSARQQQVLMSLREQAMGLDLIPQLPTLIGQFGDSVRTDISLTDAVKLARLGTEIPQDRISQVSLLPALYDDQVPGGPYYLSADWNEVGDVLTSFTGTRIRPPGAAISNPDYGVPILIENGTDNEGLAGRVGDYLEANGFWNIQVANAEDGGDYDKTTIHDRENNLGTSALITNLIGVGADTITLGDDGDDVNLGDHAIVITLGDDAPDPASDEWNLQDYQRESAGDGAIETAP